MHNLATNQKFEVKESFGLVDLALTDGEYKVVQDVASKRQKDYIFEPVFFRIKDGKVEEHHKLTDSDEEAYFCVNKNADDYEIELDNYGKFKISVTVNGGII